MSLSVAPEDDIDAIARSVFGAIIPKSGGGYLTKVHFHIEHVDGRGRIGTLQFDVFGRNKSTIQNERDPAKRALGYDLLEAWGVSGARRRSSASGAKGEAPPAAGAIRSSGDKRLGSRARRSRNCGRPIWLEPAI